MKLMVRAHAAGALDFARSDRYDSSWLMCERLVINHLQEVALAKVVEMRHLLHASAVSAEAGSEVYAHHFDQAQEALRLAGELLAPWLDWQQRGDPADQIKEWEKEFNVKVGSKEWNAMLKQFELINKQRQMEDQDAGS